VPPCLFTGSFYASWTDRLGVMAIAIFSVIKMGLLMLLNPGGSRFGCGLSYYYHQPDGPFWPTTHPYPASYSHQFRSIFLLLLCVVFILIRLRLLTFARGAAVLVTDGVLVYMNFNRSFFLRQTNLRRSIASPSPRSACFAHRGWPFISGTAAGIISRSYS